jgi:hypothetical protein
MARKAWLLLNCLTLSAAALGPVAFLAAAQQPAVNGTNVTRVEFASNNSAMAMVMTSPGQWREYTSDGRPDATFIETGRDEWSVYLVDQNRALRVQMDLFTRQLSIVDANGNRQVRGTITASSAVPQQAVRQPAAPVTTSQPAQRATTARIPPTYTAPVDPAADRDDFDPFAAPGQSSPVVQQPAAGTVTPQSGRAIVTAAAQRPLFTQTNDTGDTGAPTTMASGQPFEGQWVVDGQIAQKSGDGLNSAVTWTFREALWITQAEGSIAIHFDANPAGSITLTKVGQDQYSGSGYTARFVVISKKNIRLRLDGGGTSRDYVIATVPSGAKLSRSRIKPETDDEIDTFTAGNLIPRFNDMFFSYRSEKMDLFDANSGRGLRIFKAPGVEDFSIESEYQSKTIPYGLRALEIRRTEANQLESLITNSSSFEKSMSLNFGASGSFKGVSSGWEATREESKGADRSDGTTKAFGLARAEVYALFLDRPNMLLDPGFKYDVLQLADGQLSAASFVSKYGTHFANAIHYGGIGKNQRTVTSSEFKQWARESTSYKQEGGVDAGPVGSIKAKGGLTIASGNSRGGNSMFSSETWSSVGGAGSMSANGWSVDERNSVPVRYDLRPLSELISPIFFGEEWGTAKRGSLLNARARLDSEITRYLQSQPQPDNRTLGPAVYQVTFHSLKCVSNGDEGTADANLYGDVNVSLYGMEPEQTVNLFTAAEGNPTKISCNGGAELPINRTEFVTGARSGPKEAKFLLSVAGLYEDDNSFSDLDDVLIVGLVPTFVTLRDWRADQPRTDIAGTAIGNLPGSAGGPDLRVKVSFKQIQ